MTTTEEINRLLQGLSTQSLEEIRTYVESVRRKEIGRNEATWCYDFLEHFREAIISASRDRAGVECKVENATCAGVERAALWEHPPGTGAISLGYHVPIPTQVRGVKLKFAIGIRDGAQLPTDRYVAFRLLVNGWKLWSTIKNSHAWEEHEIKMPQLSSDVVRIEFVTDGLGDSRWNWAVWAEPRLES